MRKFVQPMATILLYNCSGKTALAHPPYRIVGFDVVRMQPNGAARYYGQPRRLLETTFSAYFTGQSSLPAASQAAAF